MLSTPRPMPSLPGHARPPGRIWAIRAFAAWSLAALPAAAASSHGLAMHGDPALPADFEHYPHVNPDAPRGGTLTLGRTGTFDTLNPFTFKGAAPPLRSRVWASLMHRSPDEPFTLYGLVAESVETPADRSSVTFRLRPEARFQDGAPIRAEDVVFTWRAIMAHGKPNARRVYALVDRVETPDDRSVTFHFKRARSDRAGGPVYDRELPLIVGMMPVVSKSFYSRNKFDATSLKPPVGSGPYRVGRVDPGRTVILERIDDHWTDAVPAMRGRHNFQTVRFEYFRNDTARREAFAAGQTDFRPVLDPSEWEAMRDLPRIRDGRIVLREQAHGRSGGMHGLAFNMRRDRFADRRTREALTLLIDFNWMNRTLFHGAYVRSTSFFSNTTLAAKGPAEGLEKAALEAFSPLGIDPELLGPPTAPPDGDGGGRNRSALRRAVALLRAAGWTTQDGALVSTRDGAPFTVEFLVLRPRNKRVALLIAAAMKRIGIAATVRMLDSAQYTRRIVNYDFDMIFWTWNSSLSPGNEQAFYWTTQAADRPGTRNYPGIRDPLVDNLAFAIAESRDRETLVARSRALDRVLRHGLYILPLWRLPVDRVAHSGALRLPQRTPLYGLAPDTWWRE